jgi:hypothetical protein
MVKISRNREQWNEMKTTKKLRFQILREIKNQIKSKIIKIELARKLYKLNSKRKQ